MGEESKKCERSRDAARRAVGRVRAGRTGPAARRDQGCQIRERTIVDAGGFRKKSGDLVRERQAVKFAAIADWADLGTYPVVFMCAELEVSARATTPGVWEVPATARLRTRGSR